MFYYEILIAIKRIIFPETPRQGTVLAEHCGTQPCYLVQQLTPSHCCVVSDFMNKTEIYSVGRLWDCLKFQQNLPQTFWYQSPCAHMQVSQLSLRCVPGIYLISQSGSTGLGKDPHPHHLLTLSSLIYLLHNRQYHTNIIIGNESHIRLSGKAWEAMLWKYPQEQNCCFKGMCNHNFHLTPTYFF